MTTPMSTYERTRQLHIAEQKAYLLEELKARLGLRVQHGSRAAYVMIRLPMSDTLAYRKLMACKGSWCAP
jgi:hypothetical protein